MSRNLGVDVPIPVQLFRKTLLETVDVDSSEPTVSCEVVAIKFPALFVVMMELGANVVAVNT